MRLHFLLVAALVCSVVAGPALVPGVASAAGRTQESVTLTVSVVTGGDAPVGGATIEATWDGGSATETTASNGKAFVDVPRGATVRLDVESENYVRNQPYVVEDATARDVEVTVAPKGRLLVNATDADGPVEDVSVTLRRDGTDVVTGRTNAEGTFRSGTIERGEYVLYLFKSGYFRNATRVTVGENTTTAVEMRKGTVNVEFRVVDDHFSPPRPLADATVSVATIGDQRTTGGTATFTLPVNTRLTVDVTKRGYGTNETTILSGTDPKTVTLSINRVANLTLDTANDRVVVGESTTATVTNAYGEPVADASIRLDGTEVATTGENGRATFTVEAAGNHTVAARANGLTSNGVTVVGVGMDEGQSTNSPTFTSSSTATPAPGGSVPMPGFTPVTAVLAALLVGGAALRRR